jgi:hypothetical protein
MARKLLTDARETSYWILIPLLTAECSTVELPGNIFHFLTVTRHIQMKDRLGTSFLIWGMSCSDHVESELN